MAIVYSYVRFSSQAQEKGSSVARQVAMGEAWLARHPQHTLDTTLRMRDLGVSAFKGANLDKEKGDLGRFIHLAKVGKIAKGSILLLENLDRFSRQPVRKAYKALTELVEAGVVVVTLDPEQTIDENNVDDMGVVMPVIIKMQLSYEESRKKGERVGKAWQLKKEKAASGVPMTRQCPGWIELSGGKYRLIPQAAKAVKMIFKYSCQGMGAIAITKKLNQNDVPTIGRAKTWGVSYVKKILNNPATYGTYQPCCGHASHRTPVGEPIANYFPAAIDEDTYFLSQQYGKGRKLATGPNTARVRSLFTGCIVCENDGSNMSIVDKGKRSRPKLVSAGSINGTSDIYYAVPYAEFEELFVATLLELTGRDFKTDKSNDNQEKLEAAQAKYDFYKKREKQLEEQLETGEDLTALVTALKNIVEKKKAAKKTITQLKQQLKNNDVDNLTACQSLAEMLDTTEGEALRELRLKLKQSIRQIVKGISVYFDDDRTTYTIDFIAGHSRQIVTDSEICVIESDNVPIAK